MTQRAALVTGAAGGLGAAYAHRLAADGFRIAIVDIKAGDGVADVINLAGGEARSYVCDITSPDAVAALIARIDAEMGGCDVLVNNAGVYDFTPHETATLALWRKMMSLNLDAMFVLTQAVIPGMKAKGWGRIINIASNSCFIPPPGLSAYVASKSASIGYVKSLSGELGQFGITVNAVAPGPTATEGTRSAFKDEPSFLGFMQQFVDNQAIKKISVPEFSAPVVSFFASEDSAFVTGQTLVVDGGDAKH
jgi:NAD(P)-dependent dehydrogenase (short-subunit alcohol dehydrogenase family)